MRTTNPQRTLRLIAINLMYIVDLFIKSYMVQILMDHSIKTRSYMWVNYGCDEKLSDEISCKKFLAPRLNGEWCRLPLKALKLLPFMIMRCNAPSRLTAGKMYVMSIQSFVMVRANIYLFFKISGLHCMLLSDKIYRSFLHYSLWGRHCHILHTPPFRLGTFCWNSYKHFRQRLKSTSW